MRQLKAIQRCSLCMKSTFGTDALPLIILLMCVISLMESTSLNWTTLNFSIKLNILNAFTLRRLLINTFNRLFKLLDKKCEPITMTVPRKVSPTGTIMAQTIAFHTLPNVTVAASLLSCVHRAVWPLPGWPVPRHSRAGACHGAWRVAGGPQWRPDSGVHEGGLCAA